MHDSLEDSFTELDGDVAAMDADTVMATASTTGLDRWGIDLAEQRLPDQSDSQYATMLQQIKQGRAVNEDGIRYALDKWGFTYKLLEFGDAQTFWDQAFYDQNAISVPQLQITIVFADPFNGQTPTQTEKATWQNYLNNAVNDVNRVKARGVQIVAVVPTSLQ